MSLESKIQEIGQKPLPAHVAVIMDGNGRWAKTRGLDRSMGHVEGVNAVRRITEIASDLGVKYLTLYTFSTENWNRPQEEVDALMHLISIAIERETPDLVRNNVRLKIIGDTKTVPDYALDRLRRCEETTASCTGMWMVLAISYSSRWEITDAVKRIAAEAAEGKIDTDSIDEATISSHLATAGIPDPDLMIRRRRLPCEQLPAVADCILRADFHRHVLARLYERGLLRCNPALPEPRTAIRKDKRTSERTKIDYTTI